jgi:hypothetical protein
VKIGVSLFLLGVILMAIGVATPGTITGAAAVYPLASVAFFAGLLCIFASMVVIQVTRKR